MIKQSEKRNKPRGGPGKAFRAGMSLIELFDMFPNENSALEWFEDVRWAKGRYCGCGHCASIKTREVKGGKPKQKEAVELQPVGKKRWFDAC